MLYLPEILTRQATQLGDRMAFTVLSDGGEPSDTISYAELARRSQSLAAKLLQHGFAGQQALLLYPAGIDFLIGFFGCLLAGVVAVPAPPPESNRQKRSGQRLRSILDDCHATIALTSSITFPHVTQLLSDINMAVDVWASDQVVEPGEWPRIIPSPVGELAYLQYTSGSTSTPKGIEITHANLAHHLRSLQISCRYDTASVSVTWMPNFHDWGLIEGLLEPFYNGTPCYLMSPFSFVRRPRQWLAAISAYRGTHSQGPSFAYEHCLRRIPAEDLAGLQLDAWKVAGIAAEPIPWNVMEQFHRKFQPCGFHWNTFCPAYGLGEATLMVSLCGPDKPPRALRLDAASLEQDQACEAAGPAATRTVVSCGQVYFDTDVRIVDPIRCEAKQENQVGEIWIRSPAVARGYWQRFDETREIFQARMANESQENYLRSGDLGFLSKGELFVTGRLKDLIIIRGSNHYPQDIEWTSQGADPAFQGLTSAAFSVVEQDVERVVVMQEIEPSSDLSQDSLRLMQRIVDAILDQHEIDVAHVWLVKRGSIPRTASGKVQRRASQTAFLERQLTPLAEWTSLPHSPKVDDAGLLQASLPRELPQAQQPTSSSGLGQVQETIAWLRDFAERRVNSALMDIRRSISPLVLLELGNHGCFGLQVPKDLGGMGFSYGDTVAVLQQLSAIDLSLATLVFLSNTNGLRPILNFAPQEIRRRIVPALAAGRQLAAFALTEPAAGANIGAIETLAVSQPEGGWRLRGTKRWNGSAWAQWITVIAREVDGAGNRLGISAFLVSLDSPGVCFGEESLTSGLRSIVQNRVEFQDVFVAREQRLGSPGKGLDVANDALDVGRLCVAAVSLGAMRRLDQLLERYATRREIATGRLIDHPWVVSRRNRLVGQIKAISVLTDNLSGQFDRGERPPGWILMAAKILASEYLHEIAGTVVQLLGGRGYMENNEVSRIWRDAKALTIGEGPNESLLGYLGNPRVLQDVRAWLWDTSGRERHDHFDSTCREISRLVEISPIAAESSREPWSSYLHGSIVPATILDATTRDANRDGSTLAGWWGKQALEEAALQAIVLARNGLLGQFRGELDAFSQSTRDIIGDLDQQLPGEDHMRDPLLEPLACNTPKGSGPCDARSGDVVPESKPEAVQRHTSREKLAALLRQRLP